MKSIEKAFSWYFSKQALPYWSILLLDCLLFLFSGFFVYILNEGVLATFSVFYHLLGTFCFYLIFYVAGFRMFHTYDGVLRLSSFIDLQRVGYAMVVGLLLSLLVQAGVRSTHWLIYIPYPDMVLQCFMATILMWGIRIWVKNLYDGASQSKRTRHVFIYGTKAGGISIAKSINSDETSPYVISGFVSDNPSMIGKRVMGVKVFPNDASLVEEMGRHNTSEIMVSPLKSDMIRNNSGMVDRLIAGKIKIQMIPAAMEWDGKSDLSYTQLKEVNVEDLLPRDKIEVDMDAIGEMLRGKRIMITGAAGSIGSEMVRQVAPYEPAELILIDQAETPLHDIRLMMAKNWGKIKCSTIVSDIANGNRMEEIFSDHRPEYVFHAAAYKHVPMMEDNPAESIWNNVNGTRIIADLAVRYGTKKFVMVSTDKAVNPTNVMGCSKRLCEIYVQSLDKAVKEGKVKGATRFVTTRFGNVLGSNGSVIPLFERQIKAGGPVTVTHPDIIRFFMLIPEACKLVLEAGTMGNGGEIFVFDMGNPVRIADLAQRMIQMSGAKNIEIKYTGLRDGEKLYEEVLNDKEITLPTFHHKIKIAKVREYDYADVNERMLALIRMSEDSDDMTIVAGMKAIVPEFRSQHSKYEVLDKPIEN